MKIHNKKALNDFKVSHGDAEIQLNAWQAEVEKAAWTTPHELKQRYPKASILGNQQVVFNICGNKYRLWVMVSYKSGIVLVKKIGTHREYDSWVIG